MEDKEFQIYRSKFNPSFKQQIRMDEEGLVDPESIFVAETKDKPRIQIWADYEKYANNIEKFKKDVIKFAKIIIKSENI